jgi:large subunit ribosomal protein L1
MPNPKSGSVTFEIAQAVADSKGGKVDFRVEKAGIVHAGVGKLSFKEGQLTENIRAIYERLLKLKPSTVKGQYVKGVSISSTMGLGLKVNPSSIVNEG